MQSYTREFNEKNQFWTPSNIGLTNSLIDNKLAISEQKITYSSFSLLNYGSDLSKIDITGISYRGAQSRIEIPIPSNITGNTKIIYLDFRISTSNSNIRDILTCCLNTFDGSGADDYRLGRIFKGFRVTVDNLSRVFSISDIFTGNISKLYLHFYFDNFTNNYGNEIVTIGTSEKFPINLNMKIVSF